MVVGLPGATYRAILGQEQVRKLTEAGNVVGLGIYINNCAKLPGLPAEIAADAADENRINVLGATTIQELAEKIGVGPAVLNADSSRQHRRRRGRGTLFRTEPVATLPGSDEADHQLPAGPC